MTAIILCEDYFRRRHKSNIYQQSVAGAGILQHQKEGCHVDQAVLMAVLLGSDAGAWGADRSQCLPASGQAATTVEKCWCSQPEALRNSPRTLQESEHTWKPTKPGIQEVKE